MKQIVKVVEYPELDVRVTYFDDGSVAGFCISDTLLLPLTIEKWVDFTNETADAYICYNLEHLAKFEGHNGETVWEKKQ